jgi:prevent-host-death family protein
MTHYSVAEAKNGLSGLIDKAMAGEEVVITRHGKPVVELRQAAPPKPDRAARAASDARLIAGRKAMKPINITSVELLNLMYESDEL